MYYLQWCLLVPCTAKGPSSDMYRLIVWNCMVCASLHGKLALGHQLLLSLLKD